MAREQALGEGAAGAAPGAPAVAGTLNIHSWNSGIFKILESDKPKDITTIGITIIAANRLNNNAFLSLNTFFYYMDEIYSLFPLNLKH